MHASDNTHTCKHTRRLEIDTHRHTLRERVTMLIETKGQMVYNDAVPVLARWLKYAFQFVCAC